MKIFFGEILTIKKARKMGILVELMSGLEPPKPLTYRASALPIELHQHIKFSADYNPSARGATYMSSPSARLELNSQETPKHLISHLKYNQNKERYVIIDQINK